ncbi:MAG TPA: protein kinase [Pyrinomonadaceae bacterium]
MATETTIGNYRVEEMIGRGGMGIVYRARHLTLPREVAIKSIGASAGRDLRRLKSRFEKEAYIQSQLDHPGIVKVYDYIVAEQTYYIVMEYVEGLSLAQVVARQGGPLLLERALDIFEQILVAISCAHTFVYQDQDGKTRRGLVHRDLKPANILITSGDRVKITDFGIVKLVGSENTDTFGTTYGSPQYVSPEQAEGKLLDQRSDIYSLGIILYEMLTGTLPFGGNEENLSRTEILRAHVLRTPRPPTELNPQITPEIERAILRALAKSRDERFETAGEFLRAIRHARGRETGDLPTCETEQPVKHEVGTQEIHGPTFDTGADETGRQKYVTQALGSHICAECGTVAEAGDTHCRRCGHELSTSPSTGRLQQQDVFDAQRKKAHALLLMGAASVLVLAGLIIFYARPAKAPVSGPAVASIESPSPPAPSPKPVPGNPSLLELKPARVTVDSSYDGYGTGPLTDGVFDVREVGGRKYNEGNWASDETPGPHWIELSFDLPVRITAIYVYWGFDRNRFMPSRQVELQVPDEHGSWRSISSLEPGNDYDRTAFEFQPVTTTRARIFQPAQRGPAKRPFVMWVREVKIFVAKEETARP